MESRHCLMCKINTTFSLYNVLLSFRYGLSYLVMWFLWMIMCTFCLFEWSFYLIVRSLYLVLCTTHLVISHFLVQSSFYLVMRSCYSVVCSFHYSLFICALFIRFLYSLFLWALCICCLYTPFECTIFMASFALYHNWRIKISQ